jgi:hypothetical protein
MTRRPLSGAGKRFSEEYMLEQARRIKALARETSEVMKIL